MTAILERPKARQREDLIDEPEVTLPERYELINGDIVEVEPMSLYSNEVASRLYFKLASYSEQKRTGFPRRDTTFVIPLPEDATRNRIPDISFVSFDQWPLDRPLPFTGNPIDVVPDLAVEVVSPTDDWEDVVDKAYEYLRAGVRLVWLITPKQKQVYVYKSRDDVRIVNATDALDGGDVLPGFEVNVGSLFPPVFVNAP